MNALIQEKLSTARVLLVVLLLAAQSVSFAHGVTHIGDIDTGMCRACTLYSGVNAIAGCPEPAFAQPELHRTDIPPADTGIIARPGLHRFARAPPPGQQ